MLPNPKHTDIGNDVAAFLELVKLALKEKGQDPSLQTLLEIFGKRATGRSTRTITGPEYSNLRTGNWTKSNQEDVLTHIKDGLESHSCRISDLWDWWASEDADAAKKILLDKINLELASFLSERKREALDALSAGDGSSKSSTVSHSADNSDESFQTTTNVGPQDAASTVSAEDARLQSVNHVPELLHAKADWRETNRAPGDGHWLQLFLKFGRGYMRDREHQLNLDVEIHRVHVVVDLDGGAAMSRDELIERSDTNGNRLVVRQANAWEENRAEFDIDNPDRHTPLTGRYNWFDLCEVMGAVGDNGHLEISATMCGIGIPVPPEIESQLDPDRHREHETPEARLVEAWLRHRFLPRSRRSDAGRFRLCDIPLRKQNA